MCLFRTRQWSVVILGLVLFLSLWSKGGSRVLRSRIEVLQVPKEREGGNDWWIKVVG